MRNLKKFLALVLAMLMVVSASATVSAFSDVAKDSQYSAAIDDLVTKGIVNGVGDDKFNPDGLVERYQMALMMARALSPAETDWQAGMSVFNDVTEWNGAIAYAYMNNIVTGIGDNKFAPHDGIKYQDALIMAVRALGYTVDVSGDPYWLAAYKQAVTLGLTKNVAVTNGEKTLNRAETAQIIYNMLYATPADGGATIAATNFGEATAENTTTFVITATSKQAYAEVAKAADANYVGVQALVNGIPTGDVTYLPVTAFGFAAAEADNHFGYAFDFVNYDVKTGSYDKIIPGVTPVVAYNANITKNSSAKITFNGIAYYPVEQITGAALKNELVIFNNGVLASAVKTLLTNKDGDVVNTSNAVVATFAYQSTNGAKFYLDLSTSTVITKEAATEKYGVAVDDGTYTKYDTLTADDLSSIGTYQLTMFDDDRDGKFERAIATKVYMSVYNAKDSGKETVVGPMKGIEGVTYTESLVKGNVFVYTYNTQTKVVDVIDVLDTQYGTISKLDLTDYKQQDDAAKTWLAKVTIDGTVYTVGNTSRTNVMGAALQTTATAPSSFADITDNARISYTDITKFYSIGSPVKFYAYNGVIVYAQTYAIEDSFSYMVVNELTNWDAGESFTVNAYINGVKGDYVISKFYDEDIHSYVDLSKTNSIMYSTYLSEFYKGCHGQVFKTVKLSDGTYQISDVLDVDKDASLTSFKLYKAHKLVNPEKYVFNDGITDAISTKADRIRTTASTKFYFIDNDGKVSLYTGTLANNFVINSGATVIADKIGYGDADMNGVAGTVIVYYTNPDQIEGFNLTSVTNAYVYIANAGTYTVDSADNLGLTGKSGTYYAYGTVAVNLSTGTTMKVYSPKGTELTRGFYIVDGLGIASAADMTKIGSVDLKKTDIDLADQYFTIPGVATTANKVTKLISVKYNDLSNIKTNDKGQFGDTAVSAQYLKGDLNDGTVVLIVYDAPVTPPSTNVTTNASYDYNAKTCAAYTTVNGNNAYATVQLYNDEATIGTTLTNPTKASGSAATNATYNVSISKLDTNTNTYDAPMVNVGVVASYTNGVLTVSKFVNTVSNLEIDLPAGSYMVEVTVSDVATLPMTVTYFADAN